MIPSFVRRLVPDPFIIALLATVTLASVFPAQDGFADIVSAVSTAAIMLLFFLHGAKLPREAIVAALTHWRLHLAIMASTFLVFPLVGFALAEALPDLLPPSLWTGVLFLCALPSTVQSSIAFTAIAKGNVAGAVTSAAASNVIGIGLTPVIIGLLARAHGGSAPLSNVREIALTLLLPFIAGHLLRPWLAAWVTRNKRLVTLNDRGTIILAVYSAFSAAVVEGIWQRLPIATLLVLAGVCAAILAIILVATWEGSRLLGFDREDRLAILFCGSKKTLASGVPMARVLFAGPNMGVAILPLLIFHQLQLIVCAWLARRFARDANAPADRQLMAAKR
jgi:sodium/bile acid cotransporter 7